MNGSLSLAVSWWYVPLCVLVAFGYAWFMYVRGDKRDQSTSVWWYRILPFLRFAAILAVLLLLLGPMWRGLDYVQRSARLLVLVDASASMAEAAEKEDLPTAIAADLAKLTQRFDLQLLQLDQVLEPVVPDSLDFTGTRSDYGQVFPRLMRSGGGVPDLVLWYGDGLYNKGQDPVSLSGLVRQPIFTVGLGDTSIRKDLAIRKVYANPTAMVGGHVVFNLDLEAWDCTDEQAALLVKVNGQAVWSETVSIGRASWFQERAIGIPITREGLNRVEVEVKALQGERNTVNNRTEFYIRGLEQQQRIQIWSHTIHPDVGTWRSMLEQKENYQVELLQQGFAPGEQDLVILFDWFRRPEDLALFEALRTAGIPVLIQLGPSVDATLMDRASILLGMERSGAGYNQVQAAFHPDFERFQTGPEWADELAAYPPLRVAFGRFTNYSKDEVLCYQKLGTLQTDQPLILLRRDRNYQYGLIAGTGIWGWRLSEFRRNGSQQVLEQLLGRMVQFAAEQGNGERLQLSVGKSVLYPGEVQRARAILLDRNGEFVQRQGLSARLMDPEGAVEERVMAYGNGAYDLELHALSKPGTYLLDVEVEHGGEALKAQAAFRLSELDVEALQDRADHRLLRQMSERSGGRFSPWSERREMVDGLLAEQRFMPRMQTERSWQQAVDWKALFWLIVGLFSMEWVIRKYIGRV